MKNELHYPRVFRCADRLEVFCKHLIYQAGTVRISCRMEIPHNDRRIGKLQDNEAYFSCRQNVLYDRRKLEKLFFK